jgi:hypothetical protein
MGHIGEQIVTIATAIIGVAILAVLVSKNSNTTGVISAAGSAFSGALAVAVSPVTGFTGGAGILGTSGLQIPSFNQGAQYA